MRSASAATIHLPKRFAAISSFFRSMAHFILRVRESSSSQTNLSMSLSSKGDLKLTSGGSRRRSAARKTENPASYSLYCDATITRRIVDREKNIALPETLLCKRRVISVGCTFVKGRSWGLKGSRRCDLALRSAFFCSLTNPALGRRIEGPDGASGAIARVRGKARGS